MMTNGVLMACELCASSKFFGSEKTGKSYGWIVLTIGTQESWQNKCICPDCVKLIKIQIEQKQDK